MNIPDPDEVMADMVRKGLTMYRVAKATGLSKETVHRYFNGKRISTRSLQLIVEFVNNS